MNFKLFCLIILAQTAAMCVQAQHKEYTYFFDDNLASVPKESATIRGKGSIIENNFKLYCYSNTTNQLLLEANFIDSSLQIFNGYYILYTNNSKIKEEGNYVNDLKVGVWKTYDKSGKMIDSTIFENGVRVKFAKYFYYYKLKFEKNKPFTDSSKYSIVYEFTDSLRNEYTSKYFSFRNDKRELEKDVFFIGNKGIMKKYDSLQNVTIDSLFTREESEAEYLDGQKGWVKLLQQNLNPNIPIENGAKGGFYTVMVKFVVNIDGTISDIMLENDPGYGMGKEALRVINLAKKWKPAVEYGKVVKAYRRQPISFQIEEEKRRRLF